MKRKISSVKKKPLCGKKTVDDDAKIKGIPRRVTAFVGRLHKDITNEDMKDFLKEGGIDDPLCYKLSAKDGRAFCTATFKVSCDARYRDLLYNESTWPEGCELRDWVFYNKKPNSSADHNLQNGDN